nr:hypothetical protein BaRGS_012213 [Batillaria attramentaria]
MATVALLVLGVLAWVAIGVLAYFLCFRKTPMVLVNLETTIAKKQRDDCLLLREEYDDGEDFPARSSKFQ